MSGTTSTRRALISASGAGAALALVLSGRSGNAAQAFPEGQIPWAKRFFNLYANAEGVAEMRELPLPHPGAQPPYQLIRHPAAG